MLENKQKQNVHTNPETPQLINASSESSYSMTYNSYSLRFARSLDEQTYQSGALQPFIVIPRIATGALVIGLTVTVGLRADSAAEYAPYMQGILGIFASAFMVSYI